MKQDAKQTEVKIAEDIAVPEHTEVYPFQAKGGTLFLAKASALAHRPWREVMQNGAK